MRPRHWASSLLSERMAHNEPPPPPTYENEEWPRLLLISFSYCRFNYYLSWFVLQDHKGKRCYIATQHPLHETVNDFWQMVWDQKANIVVMVNDKQQEKPVSCSVWAVKVWRLSRAINISYLCNKNTTVLSITACDSLQIYSSQLNPPSREE